MYGLRGRLEDGVFVTAYASLPMLASLDPPPGRPRRPHEPPDLRSEVKRALQNASEAARGAPPAIARGPERRADAAERPAGPVAPERFGLLQALLAHLLDACGERTQAEIPAAELDERFRIPPEALEEHLSLLNLVNFGGGCYAVYAELRGDLVHVDKELFGDTFRAPPRLTPLEACAPSASRWSSSGR